MKIIIVLCLFAYAYSAISVASATAVITPTFNTGTKTNSTCTYALAWTPTTLAGLDAAAASNNFQIWLATGATANTASALTDWYIHCSWTAASTAATVITASTTTTVTCNSYMATSTTAYGTTATSISTSGSAVTVAGALTPTGVASFDLVNATTANFTKSSFTLKTWYAAVISTGTALTWATAIAATTDSTFAPSACTTGMAAIKSGSSLASGFVSSLLALSFF